MGDLLASPDIPVEMKVFQGGGGGDAVGGGDLLAAPPAPV
jgi:hypothetical protein